MRNLKRYTCSLVMVLTALLSVGCVENNTFMTGPAEDAQLQLSPWIHQDLYMGMPENSTDYQFGNSLTFFTEGGMTPTLEVKSENDVLVVIAYALEEMGSEPNSTRRAWKLTVIYGVRAAGKGRITAIPRNGRSVSFTVSVDVAGKG